MNKVNQNNIYELEAYLNRIEDKRWELAVFHDYDLSMRTDGDGVEVSQYTLEELKELYIGYGYTADNGKSYPFRGQGMGMMPELKEVLEAFPDKDLLIHMKKSDLETAKVLWTYLEIMSPERLAKMTFYGNDEGLMYLKEQISDLRVLSMEHLKNVLVKYELLGWTGYIPEDRYNMQIRIPLNYAQYLWGWPYKFLERMDSVNTKAQCLDGLTAYKSLRHREPQGKFNGTNN